MRILIPLLLVLVALLAASDRAMAAPAFEGVLSHGWDGHVTPEVPTAAFFTDNASVRLVSV